MKTSLIARNFFNQQSLRKCESTSTSLASSSLLVWLRWLGHARKTYWNLMRLSVTRPIQTGLTVNLTALLLLLRNRRHVAGLVLMLVGVGSTFAHQLFFDMYAEPHDVCGLLGFTPQQCFSKTAWCYVSWYWYLDTIKFCLAAIFGAVGMILFIPPKYSLSFIPFSILQAAGWSYLIHFTFFTDSHQTINAIPHWSILTIGISLGFGIVLSSKYLIYWWNHKALGNWSRHVGVTEMKDLTPNEKQPIYNSLAKEFRQIQKTI